jgi:hypothetical protein
VTTLNLGAATGVFLWSREDAALPAGVVLDHGDHSLLVPWAVCDAAGVDGVVFTLDSLVPLTVVEPVSCCLCAAAGRIVDGAWVPEGGS